jgi:hypothetical protein
VPARVPPPSRRRVTSSSQTPSLVEGKAPRLGEYKSLDHGSSRVSKPRITVLTRARSNLTDRLTEASQLPSWTVRLSLADKDVSTEAEEYLLLGTVTT